MKLIVVSSEHFPNKEEKAFDRLFSEGLGILHLRKPGAEKAQIEKILRQIDAKYHPRIVLHDHFSLTDKYDLKGIHLNQRNPFFSDVGKKLSRSRSCHTLTEIEQYKPESDYLFLSPIFDSISKTGYTSNFSEKDLSEAAKKGIIDSKVIALGGITLSNIDRLKRYGFGGIAILGAIWNDFEKNNDLDQLAEIFRNIKSKCCNSLHIPTLDTITCNQPNRHCKADANGFNSE